MKTYTLFTTPLSEIQKNNTELNRSEFEHGATKLASFPRRIVLELTNRCNFRCIMCGREAADFQTTDMPLAMIKSLEPAFPYVEEITLHGWGEGTLHPQFVEILMFLNTYPLLRKYFVTNGSTLGNILPAIFDHHVDLVALSLDGASPEINDSIRKGGDFQREISTLKALLMVKKNRNLDYPYVNFVFTAMQRNIDQLADLVTLAGELGVPEVKVVYLTVFKHDLLGESLYNKQKKVRAAFNEASRRARDFNINLKLPEIQGDGEVGADFHKTCSFPWRDLYLGSDGFIRPCQSSPEKLVDISKAEDIEDLWNAKEIQAFREVVNDPEKMFSSCKTCYHSTCANWNLQQSFVQLEQDFAPSWEKVEER